MATIVLVDDVKAARLLVQRTLERTADWQVVASVATPAEAISACQTHRPDVVFVDMNLPAQGARMVISPLRHVHPTVRIIAVCTGDETEAEIKALGAQAMITKPVSADELDRVVLRVLAMSDEEVANAPRQAAGLASILRVVVVEDDQVTRRMLTRMVGRLGGDVVGEATALTELEPTLREALPDLLLLDVNLSDGSSLDFLSAHPEMSLPPTIIISSHADRPTVEAALRVGAGAYVLKPVQPSKLAEAMQRAMQAS
ncbi:MAG: response regulator [Armatimonadetes bacterium]|nr:response regulator [Armatimonadota bacterium]